MTIVSSSIFAQEPAFTQFFTMPLYLNPAFAGATEQYRFNTSYRSQWNSLPTPLETNVATFDYHLPNYNVGLGAILSSDRITNLGVSSNSFSVLYSYSTYTDNWIYRFGLQAGIISRSISYAKLVFGDQLLSGSLVSKEKLPQETIFMPDFSIGFTGYQQDIWYGFAIHHLNRPQQTVIQSSYNDDERLPARFSVHAGGRYRIKDRAGERVYILPSLLFQYQNISTLLDFSTALRYNDFSIGLTYKGSLSKPSSSLSANRQAIALFTGLRYRGFRFGYSFEYGLKGNNAYSIGNSHEISLVFAPKAKYKFKKKIKDNTRVYIPIYGFY
ncbi:MAG: hypothetical protein OHK0038_12950 [Flammeovirgaceae bacterium]